MKFVLCFLALVSCAAAADAQPAKPPSTPPEVQAFRDARKIEDPEKRLAAYQEVIRKYPKHYAAQDARFGIFETTVEKWPADRQRILKSAEEYIKATDKDSRRYSLNSVATVLLNAKVLLPEGEQYVRTALAAYKQDKYFKDARKDARKSKQPAPTDAELLVRFNESRSTPTETLGLIVLAQGRTEEGRKLLEEAYSYDRGRGKAAAALAALVEKNGDETKALELAYMAQLSGRMPKDGRALLERLHKKAKGGTLENLESTLDGVYREKFPPPLHAEPYRPQNRAGRVVLAEVFTGAGCPPCAAADLAFDVVMERYPRTDVAVLMYHQHIPRPDPMTFPASEARFKWYARGGVPTYVIDGKADGGGGPRRETPKLYAKINGLIEKRLSIAPAAKIVLHADEEGGVVNVKATVEGSGTDKKDARLHVVLAEKELRYTGENGIRFHPMVVRGIREFDVDLSKPSDHAHRFELAQLVQTHKAHLDDYEANGRHGKFQFAEKKHDINAKHLVVVAFVQDPADKEVLQSIVVDLSEPAVLSNR